MDARVVDANVDAGPRDVRGIYAEWNAMHGTDASETPSELEVNSLDVPGINGVFIAAVWETIEPTRDAFAWTSLDNMLRVACDADRSVELSVNAGAEHT